MTDVTMGSGNVFADLALPDAEEMMVKAQLAAKIHRGTGFETGGSRPHHRHPAAKAFPSFERAVPRHQRNQNA